MAHRVSVFEVWEASSDGRFAEHDGAVGADYSTPLWSTLLCFALLDSGMLWYTLLWCTLLCSGLVWSTLVCSGVVWSGLVWSGLVRYAMLYSRAYKLTSSHACRRSSLQAYRYQSYHTMTFILSLSTLSRALCTKPCVIRQSLHR